MPKLTATFVRQVKIPKRYADGDGLYLQVRASDDPENPNKSWVFRWGAGGKGNMGLGTLKDVSLAEARVLAAMHHRTVSSGENPRKNREKQRLEAKRKNEAMTFGEASLGLIAQLRPTWTNRKSELEWTNTLKRYAYPVIEKTICSEVTVDHIQSVLDPIWETKHETALKLRGRIENVLDWAAAKEERSGENPAVWRGRLKKLLLKINRNEKIVHFAAMNRSVLPKFISSFSSHPSLSAKALLLCILTATRTKETIQSQWSEFDLANGIWIIPKERMKKRKEHRVPLSTQAIEIINSIPRRENSPWVFNGRSRTKSELNSVIKHQALSNMAMLNFLQETLGYEKMTVHGFRSTFRDWAGETTEHQREVIEHALSHKLADQAEAAYQRGDYLEKRKVLMQDWADYCFSVGAYAPVETEQPAEAPSVT